MLTVYGSKMSRAFRVLWLLREIGVPFTHVETGFLDGGCHVPEFLKINPNGRVPAIDDNGVLMFESMAINLYLADKYHSALSVAGSLENALAMQWSFWALNEAEKALLFVAFNRLLFAEPERRPEEAAIAVHHVQRPLAVLDQHLQQTPFVLGQRFTVADLNVASVLALIPITGIDIEAYPAVQAWLAVCLERPAAEGWDALAFTIPRPSTHLGMLAMLL